MSVRYRPVKDDVETKSGDLIPTVTRKEVALMELGPVVMPVYQDTEVSVRSEISTLISDDAARGELATALVFGGESCSNRAETEAGTNGDNATTTFQFGNGTTSGYVTIDGTTSSEPKPLRHLTDAERTLAGRLVKQLKGKNQDDS